MRLRTQLLLLLAVSIAVRSLIAPGYMPQPLSAHGPLALCHSGMPSAAARLLLGHGDPHPAVAIDSPIMAGGHHHAHHPSHDSSPAPATSTRTSLEAPQHHGAGLTHAELCPLGDGLGSAVPADFLVAIGADRPAGPAQDRSSSLILTPALSPFQARGPPPLSFLS